jgi:hypothetical protein
MTHALHRKIPESEEDYVLMIRSSAGINRDGAGQKLLRLLKQIEPLGPVNFGNAADGNTLRMDRDDIKKNINDGSNLHIVFKDAKSVRKAVEIAKEMDTGLSLSLTGPLDLIRSMASQMNLNIDSIQIDLGTLGKKDFDSATEGIMSLCGHMRVAENLIKEMITKVKSNQIDPEDAAKEIGKVCLCGCFNTQAASTYLRQG